MSEAAVGYVRPKENNESQICKKCEHSIIDHLHFQTGKLQDCIHIENEDLCSCDGFYF